MKHVVEDHKDVRCGDWNNKEVEVINPLMLLTAKPVIYLVNLSENDYIRKKNKWLAKIHAWVQTNNAGDILIPFSGALESRVSKHKDAILCDVGNIQVGPENNKELTLFFSSCLSLDL